MEVTLPRLEAFFENSAFSLVSLDKRIFKYGCPQTGSTLKFMASSQPVTHRRGRAFHLIVFDEVDDNPTMWDEFYARVVKVGGDVIIGATPETAYWVRDKVERNPALKSHLIKGTTFDNMENLPWENIKTWINSLAPNVYAMRVLGEYGTYEGSIFPMWNKVVHTCKYGEFHAWQEITPDVERYRLADWTYSDTTHMCCLWVAISRSQKQAYVYNEYYQCGADQDIHIDAIMRMSEGEAYRGSYGDYNAPNIISQFNKRMRPTGYTFQASDTTAKIMKDIPVLQSMFAWKGTPDAIAEPPKLKIVEDCVQVIEDIENWQFDEESAKPKKKQRDHGPDALKFGAPLFNYLLRPDRPKKKQENKTWVQRAKESAGQSANQMKTGVYY